MTQTRGRALGEGGAATKCFWWPLIRATEYCGKRGVGNPSLAVVVGGARCRSAEKCQRPTGNQDVAKG